ncbi:acyl-CoA dehydrogenase family protein [Actinomadura madurae]|uniref:acyl-CoA dehydrogenase family protein n=1 Tax=Actinomadura madurae TaxID=1993 RepID=UPI00399BC0BE
MRLSLPGAAPAATDLRLEVRAFLEGAEFTPRCDSWLTGFDPAFSRRLGERGWLGMTVPRRLGGHGRGPLERFTVIEELLAAGAPVAAHWVADRQMAPALVAHGSSEQRRRFLPAIVRGECFFAIGMSEPDSGSDLASARTRARRVRDGWSLTGTKVWSSGAHRAHVILALARTAPPGPDRRAGLSQFLVTLPHPAVTIRPIGGLAGEHHFNEVTFDEAFVPDGMLLGRPGAGWGQVTAELAHERGGPERMLSTFPLIRAAAAQTGDDAARRALGGLLARLWTLRQASMAVAGALERGDGAGAQAALVKDLGTRFEREVIDVVRAHIPVEPDPDSPAPLARALAEAVVQAPGFTLRGGTTEILRGIVARELGVR